MSTTRPTFGQQLAVLQANLAAEGLADPAPAPRSVKQALRVAKPRYSPPTACVICGGALPESAPAYCSMACAVEGRERYRKGTLR